MIKVSEGTSPSESVDEDCKVALIQAGGNGKHGDKH
jgi:hypothetical protein